MELVYLWVDKYKNIEKQGFNFSPNFDVEFTPVYEDKKLSEKSELKITPKVNPLKDFFGKDINVTAIVGENGSGKSSLLELIYILLSDNNVEINLNFILIIQKKSQLYYISDRIINNEEILKLEKLEKNDYYILRNEKFIFSERDDSHQINMDNSSINQQIALCSSLDTSFKLTSFMYIPMKMEIKPILSKVLIDILNEEISINYIPQKIYYELLKTNREDIDEFDEDFDNKIFTVLDADNIMDDFHKFLIILFKSVTSDKNFLLNKEELLKEYLNLKYSFSEDDFRKYFINRTINLDKLTDIEKEIYFKDYTKFFNFDFIDSENRKYSNLSCGEKKMFGLFVNIYSKSFDLEHKEIANIFSQRPNDYIVHYLLDEPDTLLHPQWQKQFIKELIYLLERIDGKYNIIVTSHSPFILSDLPKENIIFLEKGKQVYPFDDGKQTFGANIHTLLSHGFFMKDGLMGEFAKSKIDLTIKYLNQKVLTQEQLDYCENIIPIIGEPIIKRELQRKLDSKRLSKLDKIDEIEKQMKIMEEQRKFLEHRLELIRKNQK